MTDKTEKLKILEETGVIAIIRADNPDKLVDTASALKEGGIKFIEVTMTTPGALKAIENISKKVSGIVIGAGSVLDAETARAVFLAGGDFIVTPTLNKEVILLCNRYSKIVVPGAFTPTEIITAWECGADIVKVFPSSIGGCSYIKAVKAPLPQVKLAAVGGVNIDNAADFIRAGASVVGVGGSLIKKEYLKDNNFKEITSLSRKFIDALHIAGER
ncbi:bifunctional 4-hydroxy-2-oxoglutarate aldolase/2-dehydro-3-deoxy-phosphogluconate aldolase [bacterium]|nr:bifunctional 4-hydroxy-2-oxoglutarate aldolase/2-dehydro-3-deoxy-phosphogluconate aldolase [bacterium]